MTGVNLTVVAFLGVAEFSHRKPLQIKIETGEIFTAEDEFADQSPAANVGQYALKSLLLKLPINQRTVLLLTRAKRSPDRIADATFYHPRMVNNCPKLNRGDRRCRGPSKTCSK